MSEIAVAAEERRAPSRIQRVASVWYRHWTVYSATLFANATPAVLEPVFFMLAIGLGLGRFIEVEFMGLDYAAFMAPGILAMTSLYTAAFEATYGTFVRSRFQQTYDAMRATPLTVPDIFTGELLWCGTKGAMFATIVGLVLLAFGKVLTPWAVLIPLFGFLTAIAFAGISFVVTSLVKTMNHFQFYFTIGITPLVYFSGLMFPVQELPAGFAGVAYALPMFHVIESFRLITSGITSTSWSWICPGVLVAMAFLFGTLGVWRMTRRTLG